MNYYTILPPESLKRYIRFFWVYEAEFSVDNPYIHPSTATIYPKLAFMYKGNMDIQYPSGAKDKIFHSGFQMQTRRSYKFLALEKIGVFGIYFYPHALTELFSTPAEEISNLDIEVSELLGAVGKELEEKIMSAHSNNIRMDIITSFFEKKICDVHPENNSVIKSIEHIIQKKGNLEISDLMQYNFVSYRQFERKFKYIAGFNPKLFMRISRFENSVEMLLNSSGKMTDTVYECGYYDQSHFIRDFKEFAGDHPSAYLTHDLSAFKDK